MVLILSCFFQRFKLNRVTLDSLNPKDYTGVCRLLRSRPYYPKPPSGHRFKTASRPFTLPCHLLRLVECQDSLWVMMQPMRDRVVLPLKSASDNPHITPKSLVVRIRSTKLHREFARGSMQLITICLPL